MTTNSDSYWDQKRSGFDELPQLREGESKDIRIADEEHVIIRMKPTLHSYTHERSDTFEGTDTARLRASEILWKVLEDAGVQTNVVHVGEDYYVTKRMKQQEEEAVPPIEVVVKARHTGTPKHRLRDIESYPTRSGGAIQAEFSHEPYVRFDFTNPVQDENGKLLHDECIPIGLADRFIDTRAAEQTALKAFNALHHHMSERGVRLDDICFKIDASGKVVFGEVSQDCMRAVEVGQEADFFEDGQTKKGFANLGKQLFRDGGTKEDLLACYDRFTEVLSGPPIREAVPPRRNEPSLAQKFASRPSDTAPSRVAGG